MLSSPYKYRIIGGLLLSLVFTGSVYAATKVLPKVTVSGEQAGIKKSTPVVKTGSTRTGSVTVPKTKTPTLGKTNDLKIPDLKNIDPLELEDLIKIYVNGRIKELKDNMKGRCPAGKYVVGFEDDGTKICEGIPSSSSNTVSPTNTTTNSSLPFASNIAGIGAKTFMNGGKKYLISSTEFRATWTEVNTSCTSYSESEVFGWRLPTKQEFNSLLDSSSKSALVSTNNYWTSTSGSSDSTKWKKMPLTGASGFSPVSNTYSAVCILEVQ